MTMTLKMVRHARCTGHSLNEFCDGLAHKYLGKEGGLDSDEARMLAGCSELHIYTGCVQKDTLQLDDHSNDI